MTKLLLLASLLLLSSCRSDIHTESSQAVKAESKIVDYSAVDFAFELFRNDLNEDLFLLDFNDQVNQELSLTQSIEQQPKIWELEMADIGHKISHFADTIDFSQKDVAVLRDIARGLRQSGIDIPKDKDLFDLTLSERISVSGNASPEFNRSHFIRRNFLAVITAVQWHLQAVRVQEYPDWEGVRGGTTIHDNYFIPRLYAKYIAFENNIEIDFGKDINNIYKQLSEKMEASKSFNTFAYLRQKASSHLRQKDLLDVRRFGIDMRFLEKGNALPILPNGGRHIHLGSFKFEEYGSDLIFFKEESHGFGSKADKISHAKNYLKHIAVRKASSGPRETSTPTELVNRLHAELKNAGYKNETLLNNLRRHSSKKKSLNLILKQLVTDISMQENSQIFQAKLNEVFNTSEIIGSEYVLTKDKIAKPLKAHTLNVTLAKHTKVKTNATRKAAKYKSERIKWPVTSRLKL